VSTVKALSELILSGIYGHIVPEEYKKHVEDIHDTSEYLQEFLANLLSYTQRDSALLPVTVEKVTVSSMAERARKLVSFMMESRKISVTINPSCDLELTADPTMIVRVITNLLSNAVRHSSDKSTVEVTAEQDGKMALIKVSDQGTGMTAEQVEELMTPFEQSDQHIHKDQEGTGLGLSVSRYLVELHQGDLTLESSPGHGTTAVIRLPLTKT